MHSSKTASIVTVPRLLRATALLSASVTVAGSLVACGSSERQADPEIDDVPGAILIENGEDGNNTSLENELGFVGFWYTFDDRCECENADPSGETTPTPAPLGGPEFTMTPYTAAGAVPLPPEGEQESNTHGIRVQGGGHTLFGAGVGVGLNNQSGSLFPFDLTAQGWTGLRFWARSGVEPIDLKVRISDVHSEPAGGMCMPRPDSHNQCDPMWDGTSCDTQGCFDSATTTIEVGTEWALHEIPFSMLMREGWGAPRDGVEAPDSTLAADQAYQVQFAVPQNLAQFDLWLDNVGFIAPDNTGG